MLILSTAKKLLLKKYSCSTNLYTYMYYKLIILRFKLS